MILVFPIVLKPHLHQLMSLTSNHKQPTQLTRVLAPILTSSVKDSRHLLMVVILTLKSDSQGVTKTLMNRTINTNKKSLKIPEG
jgi:hypothetical protein